MPPLSTSGGTVETSDLERPDLDLCICYFFSDASALSRNV
jgi:hypothetical protein